MALASITDYQEITGLTVASGADTTRVNRILGIASDLVLASANGQKIIQGTSTEVLEPVHGIIRFPQRPVTAVSDVTLNGVALDPSQYKLEPGGYGHHATLTRLLDGYPFYWGEYPYRVIDDYRMLGLVKVQATFTYGWDPIPDPIIYGCVVAVQTVLASTEVNPNLQEERVDDHLLRWFQGHISAALPESVLELVAEMCGVPAPGSTFVVRDR